MCSWTIIRYGNFMLFTQLNHNLTGTNWERQSDSLCPSVSHYFLQEYHHFYGLLFLLVISNDEMKIQAMFIWYFKLCSTGDALVEETIMFTQEGNKTSHLMNYKWMLS